MTPARKTLSRLTVLTIFLLCFVPLLLAWVMYFGKNHWHFKTTAHGTLLQPPLSLQQLDLPAGIAQQLKGHWVLMRTSQGNCDTACQRSLYFMRQIHVATGKDSERVRRLWVSVTAIPQQLTQKYTSLAISTISEPQYLHFMDGVKLRDKNTLILQPAIFIVDPLGNIVLRYPQDTKGGEILADLKKLLGVSNIG